MPTAAVVLLPLLLQSVGLVALPPGWRLWATIAVGAVFAWYFWRNIGMALSIGREVRRVNEATYADTDDRIYTEPHITADMLMQRLGTNANYLTEVIRRSGYSSFYDMVNQHRVRHAIALIRQHPDRRMRDVAAECGFANPASMNRAFASQGKPAPSTFRMPE